MTTTNQQMKELVSDLRKKETKLLSRVANDLSKPTRIRREVNLTRINRFTKEGEVIIVPGKVLGGGELDHKITISAFKFSEGALSKLQKSGSIIIPMSDLAKEKLENKRVRIIG